jgi:ribosome maturation factor RimP
MLPVIIENKLEEIRGLVEEGGAELIEVNFRRAGSRSVLTVIADKAGGISLDECAQINNRLSAFFDGLAESDLFFEGPYYLEVNSPGLDRPMRAPKDFALALGETVRLFFRTSQGANTERVGEILESSDKAVKIRVSKDGSLLEVPMDAVIKGVREIKFR